MTAKTKTRRGQPSKPAKDKKLCYAIRLTSEERTVFSVVAQRSGLTLAAWLRTRARTAAQRECSDAGKPIPFNGE
jgi:hypothetical protein